MLKSIFVFLGAISFGVNAQITTLNLPIEYDVALGYHDNYGTANNNYATATQLSAYCINGFSGGLNINRSLFKFDLSQIPECATIISAKLDLFALGPIGTLNGHSIGNNSAEIRRVNESWNLFSVTWNNQPSSSTLNQVLLPPSTTSTEDYLGIDVTDLVIDMVNLGDNGFLIKQVIESPTRVLLFCSQDYANSEKHPVLKIEYESCEDSVGEPNENSDVSEYTNELLVPNVFTPNESGVHDVYEIKTLNQVEIKLTILNRWGQTVFESTSINPVWDGKLNGILCEEGVYFVLYSVKYVNDEFIEGQSIVHLVR